MWGVRWDLQGATWLWIKNVFDAFAYLALARSKLEQNPLLRLFIKRDLRSPKFLPA